jgi:hypothetical protein
LHSESACHAPRWRDDGDDAGDGVGHEAEFIQPPVGAHDAFSLKSCVGLIDAELRLPTSEDLPCSDDTPVDNEYQNTIPTWLLATLEQIWGKRQDWFFGVDMGVYDREAQRKRTPAVVPDGFLRVGVQRHKRSGRGRLSYVLQERQRAEQQRQRAEQEYERAKQQRQRTEAERQRAEQERLEKLRLLERLRQLGVEDEQL